MSNTANKTTSTAERVAESVGNDGQLFDGLEAACEAAGGSRTARAYDSERWSFRDGSSIVVSGAAWDLGVPGSSADCYCWDPDGEGEHHEDCEGRTDDKVTALAALI
ncbi:MAG TPA: hypothetical protein VFH61_08445 [Thermoleophilia bacterium]|nr:hypothetical protein [Thermoleophilia bacterium]